MSNELSTSLILICPEDKTRTRSMAGWPTNQFAGLSTANISYFVGVDVTNEMNPQLFLSGDCNFEIGRKPVKSGLLSVWTNDPVAWAATRHKGYGNLSLADGSVQSATSPSLRIYLGQTGLATNRLAIP
jgi:prepilin-type processing-associated H-X9-DG protein